MRLTLNALILIILLVGASRCSNITTREDLIEVKVYDIVLNNEYPVDYISSPGFPYEEYPPSTQIEYYVTIDFQDEVKRLSSRILIYFESFALEESPFCTSDGLEIVDIESKQTRVYCGGSHTGRTILSDDSTLHIRFFSNSKIGQRGFKLKFELYESDCSYVFHDVKEGEIQSPYHPTTYRKDDVCVWKIIAPNDHIVRLEFDNNYEIKGSEPLCAQDYIGISVKGNISQEMQRYCGTKKPGIIKSIENIMMIKFRTDCCFEGKGFLIKFKIEEKTTITKPPVEVEDKTCSCGIENIQQKRIVGGEELDPPNRHPWMVAIYNEIKDIDCGGVLINRQYVLTASHCIHRREASKLSILLGGHYLPDSPDPVPVEELILHEKYDPTTYVNDIGLIKLASPVTISKKISPICLPPENLETDNSTGIVEGWGREHEAGYSTQSLRFVEVPTVNNAECAKSYGSAILSTNLCAGETGKDSCRGDSGGPLIQKIGNRFAIVGIVSFGIGCGRPNYPGVYSRITSYLEWIRSKISSAPACDGDIEPPIQPNIAKCGIPNNSQTKRIAGGTETASMEYPWIALIVSNKKIQSHGALISPTYVLTSANSISSWYAGGLDSVEILLGQHRLREKDPYTQKFKPLRIVLHPKANHPKYMDNDLALIELDAKAPEMFRPICLPPAAKYKPGTEVVVAGWGRTGNRLAGSTVLRHATLKIVSEYDCNLAYPNMVTDTMLCAQDSNKDACDGDQGTPLMYMYKKRFYSAGVFSANSNAGCAIRNRPSIFSSTSANLKWISEETGIQTE